MKIQELLDELREKYSYNEFKKRYNDSFLSAGFFILDTEKKNENLQLDFFIPSLKKIAGFEFPFKEFKIFEEEVKEMKELDTNISLELDELKNFCEEVIFQNNSAMPISKIIAVLRDDVWNLTCMDNMLGIIRIKANAKTKEVLSFSKGSVLDMAKTIKKK